VTCFAVDGIDCAGKSTLADAEIVVSQ